MRKLLAFVAFAWFGQIGIAFGLGRNASENIAPPLSLRLEVKAEAVLGDPVAVKVHAANASSAPLEIEKPSTAEMLSGLSVKISIRKPGETAFRTVHAPGIYNGSFKLFSGPPALPAVTIPAGSNSQFDLVLDYDNEGRRWLFPIAGKYELKVGLYQLKQAPPSSTRKVSGNAAYILIESEPSTIEIKPLPNEQDNKAYEALRKLKDGWLLYNPQMAGAQLPPDVEAFLKKYAGTRWGRFGELLVISRDFQHSIDAGHQNQAQKRIDQCQKIVDEAGKNNWPQVWKGIAESLLKSMNRQYAKAA